TVDRRESARLQPASAMRRVTASSGDAGCVVKALISRWFSLPGGRALASADSLFGTAGRFSLAPRTARVVARSILAAPRVLQGIPPNPPRALNGWGGRG